MCFISALATAEMSSLHSGVRQWESATRDRRLRNTCNRDECGPVAAGKASIFPTAAPLLRWRTCEVWDFLALEAMAAFRLRLLEISRDPENRVVRPDGRLGRLTLEARRMLLLELLTLQRHTKVEMITDEEVQRILNLWKAEEDGG